MGNAIIGVFNSIISAWNSLNFNIPAINTPFGTIPAFNWGVPELPLIGLLDVDRSIPFRQTRSGRQLAATGSLQLSPASPATRLALGLLPDAVPPGFMPGIRPAPLDALNILPGIAPVPPSRFPSASDATLHALGLLNVPEIIGPVQPSEFPFSPSISRPGPGPTPPVINLAVTINAEVIDQSLDDRIVHTIEDAVEAGVIAGTR